MEDLAIVLAAALGTKDNMIHSNGIGTDVEVNFKMPVAGHKQIRGRLHEVTVEHGDIERRITYTLKIVQDYADMAVQKITNKRMIPKMVGSHASQIIADQMRKVTSPFLRETLTGKKEARKAKYNKQRRVRQKRKNFNN